MAKIRLLFITLFILILAFLFFAITSHNRSATNILSSKPTSQIDLHNLPPLKIGDWIVRQGNFADSILIRKISHSDYSHLGVIIATQPETKIIHAVADEDQNPQHNGVIISTIKEFSDPHYATKIAIFRPNFLSTNQQITIINGMKNHLGQSFMIASKEKPHLYCTTLVYDEIIKINSSFHLKWQFINSPSLSQGIYLFPQAFIDYPNVELIYQSN